MLLKQYHYPQKVCLISALQLPMETCEVLITGQEWPPMPLLPHLQGKSGFSKSFTKVLLLKSRMHFSGNFFIPDITTSALCNRSQLFASTHFTVNKYLHKRLKGPLLPHPCYTSQNEQAGMSCPNTC